MGLMFRRGRPIARLAATGATGAGPGAGAAADAGPNGARRVTPAAPAAAGTAPSRPAYVAPQPASTGAEVDELGRLAQMHSTGALTDDEFTAAKAQLLDL